MSNSDSGNNDDLSGLSHFFFYVFIVHPATAWILKPGRFERKKSIWYAIAFLTALASIKTGLEFNSMGSNHYAVLDVTRSSNPLEIKRAYKKLSLQLHPDKNPSPNASDEFDSVKQGYDILIDMELRDVYNKFGSEGIRTNKRFDETRFFLELGIYYLTWAVLSFILTLGKKNNGDARHWIYSGMIFMLIVEVYLMTSSSQETGSSLPSWFFPQTTEYEIIWLLHSLFPAYMNGCRTLGGYLYVDIEAQTRQLLIALQEQNKDILLVLRDVQINVQNVATRSISNTPAPNSSISSSSQLPVSTLKATPTGKLKELQERLQVNHSNVASAVKQLHKDAGAQSNNSSFGFYAMILGYIVISYIFS